VRIWLTRAAARLAAGECRSASKAGMLTAVEVNACGDGAAASVELGNAGQVDGAVSEGLPDAASTIVPADMAQWCAPCLRQHAGRRASSLPGSRVANGPRQKKRTSKIESARRIWNSSYTTSAFPQQKICGGQVSSG